MRSPEQLASASIPAIAAALGRSVPFETGLPKAAQSKMLLLRAQRLQAAAEATVSGFIVVDLPPEEGADFISACNKYGLSSPDVV